jgi:hypothetical protein
MRALWITFATLLVIPGDAFASGDRSPVCLLGFSLARCRTIPVLDVGVRWAPGFEPIADSSPLSVTLEGGLILNLTHSHAVGLVGGFLFDADYPAGTVRGRYRYWPLWFVPLEGSLGILIDRGGPAEVGGASAIAEVATSLADVIAVTASVEYRPPTATRRCSCSARGSVCRR